MNAAAIKRTELLSELALLPEEDLDRVYALIAILVRTKAPDRSSRSLRGIWKGKGFERIEDLETALKEARHELGAAILKRRIR